MRTGSNPPVEVPNSSDGAFNMPNYPVTCTYTNNRTSHKVELVKEWVNSKDGDEAALEITGGITVPTTGNATAPAGETIDTDAYSGETITVTEDAHRVGLLRPAV